MNRPQPWTVVISAVTAVHPRIAYVLDATGSADAIAKAMAHHGGHYEPASNRPVLAAAIPGTPAADTFGQVRDLRGHTAIHIMLTPGQVRLLAAVRLRLRRWQTMIVPHYVRQVADGADIRASAWSAFCAEAEAWEAYSDETMAIVGTLVGLLLGQGDA